MEIYSALPCLCGRNPPVTGGFPSQRYLNSDLWCSFVVSLNKLWTNTRLTGNSRRRDGHGTLQWCISVSALVALKCDGWPWKTIGHLFYVIASFVSHFVAISELKLELRSGNAQIRAKFILTCVTLTFELWPWPFAWTSLLSMVISSEILMIR